MEADMVDQLCHAYAQYGAASNVRALHLRGRDFLAPLRRLHSNSDLPVPGQRMAESVRSSVGM